MAASDSLQQGYQNAANYNAFLRSIQNLPSGQRQQAMQNYLLSQESPQQQASEAQGKQAAYLRIGVLAAVGYLLGDALGIGGVIDAIALPSAVEVIGLREAGFSGGA